MDLNRLKFYLYFFVWVCACAHHPPVVRQPHTAQVGQTQLRFFPAAAGSYTWNIEVWLDAGSRDTHALDLPSGGAFLIADAVCHGPSCSAEVFPDATVFRISCDHDKPVPCETAFKRIFDVPATEDLEQARQHLMQKRLGRTNNTAWLWPLLESMGILHVDPLGETPTLASFISKLAAYHAHHYGINRALILSHAPREAPESTLRSWLASAKTSSHERTTHLAPSSESSDATFKSMKRALPAHAFDFAWRFDAVNPSLDRMSQHLHQRIAAWGCFSQQHAFMFRDHGNVIASHVQCPDEAHAQFASEQLYNHAKELECIAGGVPPNIREQFYGIGLQWSLAQNLSNPSQHCSFIEGVIASSHDALLTLPVRIRMEPEIQTHTHASPHPGVHEKTVYGILLLGPQTASHPFEPLFEKAVEPCLTSLPAHIHTLSISRMASVHDRGFVFSYVNDQENIDRIVTQAISTCMETQIPLSSWERLLDEQSRAYVPRLLWNIALLMEPTAPHRVIPTLHPDLWGSLTPHMLNQAYDRFIRFPRRWTLSWYGPVDAPILDAWVNRRQRFSTHPQTVADFSALFSRFRPTFIEAGTLRHITSNDISLEEALWISHELCHALSRVQHRVCHAGAYLQEDDVVVWFALTGTAARISLSIRERSEIFERTLAHHEQWMDMFSSPHGTLLAKQHAATEHTLFNPDHQAFTKPERINRWKEMLDRLIEKEPLVSGQP